MRKSAKRILLASGLFLAVTTLVPVGFWLTVTHEPEFYASLVSVPAEGRAEEAKHFEAQTLQLRNDIVNEPTWEALFTDAEVNAWLAEDLVKHFADQLPPDVRDPRVMFDQDQLTLAFKYERSGVTSVVWIVGRISVPEDNVVSIAVEKVRAGALPLSIRKFVDPIAENSRRMGFDLTWTEEDGIPVARVKYEPSKDSKSIVLERVRIAKGQIKLSGRSSKEKAAVARPELPDRKLLQRNFPRSKNQSEPEESPDAVVRSDAQPVR